METVNQNPWVIEADDSTFQAQVAERSRELPVVVDFWATWCQPCRQLGPLLERLAQEYQGKFLLAKVETEKAPSIAAAFSVQSIPAVYGIRDGQLIDYFVGLLPEVQIRSWIDRLLPTPAEQLVADARLLRNIDANAAETKLREAAQLDPNLGAARILLAEVLLDQHRISEANQVLQELEARGYLEPEAEILKARIHLAEQAANPHDLEALRQAAIQSPQDMQAKLQLAAALAAASHYADALDTALAVVSSGNRDDVERAREFMVDLFRVLEDQPELVTEYRRRLSTTLY